MNKLLCHTCEDIRCHDKMKKCDKCHKMSCESGCFCDTSTIKWHGDFINTQKFVYSDIIVKSNYELNDVCNKCLEIEWIKINEKMRDEVDLHNKAWPEYQMVIMDYFCDSLSKYEIHKIKQKLKSKKNRM